ncbi:MAG: NAD(+)/NADH kinase [Patescibacteria group bacterium]
MPSLPQLNSASIFYRPDNSKARAWAGKFAPLLKKQGIKIYDQPMARQFLFVLGGDGAILEAVRRYHQINPIIVGMNLGGVGFLASVRKQKNFIRAIQQIIAGKYWIVEKMMLQATILRKGRKIATIEALNEILIQNPLGMVHISIYVADHLMQEIRGTGALIATPTGSTAFNLSAHGPLVMPDLNAIIMSEILDHNIPTPSIVLDTRHEITLCVEDFRKRELLSLTATHEKFDIILSADGETLVPLQKNDMIIIRKHKQPARFVELERNYFLKSLQEKFTFR